MKRVRVIPALLMQNKGLVKSVRFANHRYVGDPINAVRIFNEKEVDEIVLLDISATTNKQVPDIALIKQITSEAFMPVAYGGGITRLEEIQQLVSTGIEKVIVNTSAFLNDKIVYEGAKQIGSQSMVVSIDVKKNFLGKYKVYVKNGSYNTGFDPGDYALRMERCGAGEILLNSIERDGTYKGYDVDLIRNVSSKIRIPVVAIGGAATVDDFKSAIKTGASAVSAGSMFVFQRPHQAVLISYPSQHLLKQELFTNI